MAGGSESNGSRDFHVIEMIVSAHLPKANMEWLMFKEGEKPMEECRYKIPQIPIWRKYTLSIQEASEYFRIGDKKLRRLVDEQPDAEFILWNGSRPQIKRRLFEQYIDEYLTAI